MGKKKKLDFDDVMQIVISIPKDAVHLEITATLIGKNGKERKGHCNLSHHDILKLREDFVNNIGDDYNATYFLTDKGRQSLDCVDEEVGL